MVKVDLHVHSRYSAHPSEWFLQRLGTRESYTQIEDLYQIAVNRGMDYVTITDHNQIDGVLKLKQSHPETVFTGVESTTYFPEDGCKIHILIYGFNEYQFREIEHFRKNIYDLRDYLKEQNLAHSVAHATFSINKKLSEDHVCKLILLFDYFEVSNGARSKRANHDFERVLRNLNPGIFDNLRSQFKIEPYSYDSWIKGFTGGSDDHSGLTIGRTCTTINEPCSVDEFLFNIKAKRTSSLGQFNDYKGFAFNIYKIAYDFSKEKSSSLPTSIFSSINRILFDNRSMNIKSKLAVTKMKLKTNKNKDDFKFIVSDLLSSMEKTKDLPFEEKIDLIYDHLSGFSDDLLKRFLLSVSEDLTPGDFGGIFKSISGLIPVIFLSLPFLSTIHVLNDSRQLQDKLDEKFKIPGNPEKRKILWFTDTISDLNGPSETIQKLSWISFNQDLDLIPVTSLLSSEKNVLLPPNLLDLSPIWTYTPSFFSMITLRVPSILNSIKLITEKEPDEILISTPGPIGLLGILAARLLHIPCKGIYHTDFTEQASFITGDDTVCRFIEEYTKWFYGLCDEIKVPTFQYIEMLKVRNFKSGKMSIFPRGIEQDIFYPHENAREQLEIMYGIPQNRINLLYAGRISAEKNIDFLMDIFERVNSYYPNINLILAGSGPEPYFSDFKGKMAYFPNVYFLGRLKRMELPLIYSGSDLLLFPSTTDTFGMVVLEAQACGLPALVSDIGGPKEIIVDGRTGFSLPANDKELWSVKILAVLGLINSYPERFHEMRIAARNHVISEYDWQLVISDLFGLPLTEKKEMSINKV